MIPRQAGATLHRGLSGLPVVTVTGPRQSGKTTPVRVVLHHNPFVSLESGREWGFAQHVPHDRIARGERCDGVAAQVAEKWQKYAGTVQTCLGMVKGTQ